MLAIDWFYTLHAIKEWRDNEEATAFVEAALLIPCMTSMLMGVFDLGTGIVLGQKTISSSQIAADLVSRNRSMDTATLESIISAARLAYQPYAANGFGIDVVSIEFDADQQPVILWRETRDMQPNDDAVESVQGLAPEGEGIIIVTVNYDYEPMFTNAIMSDFTMQEVAFSRGRRGPTVDWE